MRIYRGNNSICSSAGGQAARGRAVYRRGLSLLEVIVTLILVGTVMATLPAWLHAIAGQQRASGERQLALQCVQNLIERTSALSASELSKPAVEQLAGEVYLPETLRSPQWNIDVSPDGAGKKISVELAWHRDPSRSWRPVRLTTWVYPTGRTSP